LTNIDFRDTLDASKQREIQLSLTFEAAAVLSVDQLWQSASPELIRVLKENRRVERKPARIHAPELAEYFSMWANTAIEGGLVAIGVADDGEFLGCLCADTKHINRIESEAHTICPDAHVECKQVAIKRTRDSADDFVLLFRVHYHPRRVVHTTRGDAFLRLGESKHKLTPTRAKSESNRSCIRLSSIRTTFPRLC
jgi:ATP-dependent DNA helicase RecG